MKHIPKSSAPSSSEHGEVLVVCVLLMLQHGVRDGDQLTELLVGLGLTRHVSALPTALRTLEAEGLISVANDGPPPVATRAYRLNVDGERWLVERWAELGEPARLVARFLDRYRASFDLSEQVRTQQLEVRERRSQPEENR